MKLHQKQVFCSVLKSWIVWPVHCWCWGHQLEDKRRVERRKNESLYSLTSSSPAAIFRKQLWSVCVCGYVFCFCVCLQCILHLQVCISEKGRQPEKTWHLESCLSSLDEGNRWSSQRFVFSLEFFALATLGPPIPLHTLTFLIGPSIYQGGQPLQFNQSSWSFLYDKVGIPWVQGLNNQKWVDHLKDMAREWTANLIYKTIHFVCIWGLPDHSNFFFSGMCWAYLRLHYIQRKGCWTNQRKIFACFVSKFCLHVWAKECLNKTGSNGHLSQSFCVTPSDVISTIAVTFFPHSNCERWKRTSVITIKTDGINHWSNCKGSLFDWQYC